MKTIGLFVNEEKELAVRVAKEVLDWFQTSGVKAMSPVSSAQVLGQGEAFFSPNSTQQIDAVIVLGGDGTLLRAARAVASAAIPILGVNLGRLGFLTELEMPDMYAGFARLLAGDYKIEDRMMLQTTVTRNGMVMEHTHALNDVVITKGSFSRMIQLETYVGEAYIDQYSADGLIISTSTGSTAYSLSAGGPIVSPDVDVMILTPICPHTLYSRTIVISQHQLVRVILRSDLADVMLTMDGQHGFKLEPGDVIEVERAPFNTRLIRLNSRNFYDIMREKLRGEGALDNS